MKVAQDYKGQVNFAVSNKDKFSAEVEDFGLKAKGDKPVVGAKNEAGQKFNMKEEFRYAFFNYKNKLDYVLIYYTMNDLTPFFFLNFLNTI